MSMPITADLSRGFDVMRGALTLAHFVTRAEADAYAAAHKGSYIRYWAVRE